MKGLIKQSRRSLRCSVSRGRRSSDASRSAALRSSVTALFGDMSPGVGLAFPPNFHPVACVELLTFIRSAVEWKPVLHSKTVQ